MLSSISRSAQFISTEWNKDGKHRFLGSATAGYLLNIKLTTAIGIGMTGYVLGEVISRIYRSCFEKDPEAFKIDFFTTDDAAYMKYIHSRENRVLQIKTITPLIFNISLTGIPGTYLSITTLALSLLYAAIN